MSPSLEKLIKGNSDFVEKKIKENATIFQETSKEQHPKYLWVGCSDSRVSPNQITHTDIGDLFIHRNIANLVVEYDLNFLSVLQYAVEQLRVEHIIVCGHYGCGGVNAAMDGAQLGLIDSWLGHIKSAYQYYSWELDSIQDKKAKARKLVELNVLEQINNLGKARIIREAWEKGNTPTLNGWVYDIETGKLNVLHEEITNTELLKVACKFERKLKMQKHKN